MGKRIENNEDYSTGQTYSFPLLMDKGHLQKECTTTRVRACKCILYRQRYKYILVSTYLTAYSFFFVPISVYYSWKIGRQKKEKWWVIGWNAGPGMSFVFVSKWCIVQWMHKGNMYYGLTFYVPSSNGENFQKLKLEGELCCDEGKRPQRAIFSPIRVQ